MLNFLSQIFGKKKPANKAVQPERKKKPTVSQDEKLEALKLAEQLPDDELAIVDFLMQCRFADVRYVAAQKIQSRQLMEQVKVAMQKTDRRVYRLMQTRLSEMAHNDALASKIGLLVGKASALVEELGLTPNLVAELDREWKAVTEKVSDTLLPELKGRFESLRSQLESRLAAQLQLQREVKSGCDALAETKNNVGLTPSDRSDLLKRFTDKLEQWKQSPERLSLPRQLLAEFETKLAKLRESSEDLRKDYEAQESRTKWLEEMEQADLSQLTESELKKQWSQLPDVKNKEQKEKLNERFQALFTQLGVEEASAAKSLPKLELSSSEAQDYFREHLSALQQAVESGAVQDATLHDDALRQLDLKNLKLSGEQLEQLEHFRTELRRLRGWAKWSGQISREKLIRSVQELPEQKLEINELAAAVVQAREQWKSLNAVSGMATRDQWNQFDSACNRAYEPVLEYAKNQADEREKNVLQAESIIEKVRDFAHRFETELTEVMARQGQFDWKPAINFYRQTTQLWRQLGMVGRKEKKRLDEAFSSVIQPVREKLYAQAQLEIGRREQLIEEVEKINPEQKEAGRMLRAIQEKWQAYAKAFPLDNREDKKLWTRFREVCERLHVQRMEKNRANDLERQQNLKEKEAICTELESLGNGEQSDELELRLEDLLERWRSIGYVPREVESSLKERLDAAVLALRKRIRQLKSERMSEALKVLHDKLELCRSLESQIARFCMETDNSSIDIAEDEELEKAWKSLPALPDKMEATLSQRFYNGLKAMGSRNIAYGKRLLGNVSTMKDNIFRFEIMYGVDSPAYLEDERLKKQMEMLQDALGGSEQQKTADVIRQLLETPALADEEDVTRINRLIVKLNEPG